MYNWLNHNITVFVVLGFIALPIMFTACDTSKKGASNQSKGDNPVVLFSTNQGDINSTKHSQPGYHAIYILGGLLPRAYPWNKRT